MSLVFFVVPQLAVKFVDKVSKIDSTIIYLVFAACLPLIWIFLPKEILHTREINFVQHAVGGGVAVAFVAFYLIQNLKSKFVILDNFLVQFLFLYALVSMLGVGNEMLEFTLDFLGVGIFSADRYDTWFDLFANTVGAVTVFLLLYSIHKVLKPKN
jgi:hypothetical protein